MTTPSQVQVEQRARSLSLSNFTKACNRYETFLSEVEKPAEENQLCFEDIVNTWSPLQEKQNEYLLKLDQEMYDNEISWIDEPENRFHALRSEKCQLDILLKEEKMKREKEELYKKTIELAESDELKSQDEIKETVRKTKEKYKVEVNLLHNICQSFENLPKVTERVLKNVQYDFDNQYKEVKMVIHPFLN